MKTKFSLNHRYAGTYQQSSAVGSAPRFSPEPGQNHVKHPLKGTPPPRPAGSRSECPLVRKNPAKPDKIQPAPSSRVVGQKSFSRSRRFARARRTQSRMRAAKSPGMARTSQKQAFARGSAARRPSRRGWPLRKVEIEAESCFDCLFPSFLALSITARHANSAVSRNPAGRRGAAGHTPSFVRINPEIPDKTETARTGSISHGFNHLEVIPRTSRPSAFFHRSGQSFPHRASRSTGRATGIGPVHPECEALPPAFRETDKLAA